MLFRSFLGVTQGALVEDAFVDVETDVGLGVVGGVFHCYFSFVAAS